MRWPSTEAKTSVKLGIAIYVRTTDKYFRDDVLLMIERALEEVEPCEEREVGRRVYRLHFNENLFLPPEYYEEVLRAECEPDDLRYYTEPLNVSFNRRLEEELGLPHGTVFSVAGADEGLSLLIHIPLLTEGVVVVAEPTYGIVRSIARSKGLEVRTSLLDENYQPVVDDLTSVDNALVYVCSPNNPTGNTLRRLEDVAARLKGILVIDEAYVEFAGGSKADIVEYGNVALLRTFSKAWGLAGLRVGYVVSCKKIVELLSRISLPHNIPAPVIPMVLKALKLKHYVEESIREMAKVREYMIGELDKLGLRPLRTETNFVSFRVGKPGEVVEELYRRGFAVKDVSSKPRCSGMVRATVPPKPIAERLLSALEEVLESVN